MQTTKLKNAHLVTPDAVVKSDIVLRDGRIAMAAEKVSCDQEIDLGGKYIVPGFVDIHFHGFDLFEFTAGKCDRQTETFDTSPSAYEQGFEMFEKKLCEYGVTGFYVATWAAPIETLKKCLGYLADHLRKQQRSIKGARLHGALLEGTFLNRLLSGAQNPKFVLEPSIETFDSINESRTVKLANVVPDFGTKSLELIEYLTGKGIIVGAGHVDSTCDQWQEAIKCGLKYCIHFTNGPTGGSYKPFNGGGSIEAVLKLDEVYAELMLDGYHVNPAYVRDIIKRKGLDKIIGITDSMYMTGTNLTGQFNIGGTIGQVSDNGEYFSVVGKKNTLCSANLTMDRTFSKTLNWLTSDMAGIWNSRHEALGFEDALIAVAGICSTNACKLVGLNSQGFGSIIDGTKADLCVLDISGSQGSYSVAVDHTIVDGSIVYSADASKI